MFFRLESSAYWLEALLGKYDLNAELSRHFQRRFSQNRRRELIESEPKVFIAVKDTNWEKSGLVDSWKDVAATISYDWGDDYDQHHPEWKKLKPQFNQELYNRVEEACHREHITHFFSYLSGRWIYPETVKKIGDLGIITINFSFDDSHRFWGKKRDGTWTGIADIARVYDLNLTVAQPQDITKYRLEKARALYLPPEGNEQTFGEIPKRKKRYLISFVGQKYGIRTEYIEYLEANNIDIHVWGEGWSNGPLSLDELKNVYAESYMILGFGFTGSSHRTAVKGRDFEVPLSGTAYCTSYDATLAENFTEGKDIKRVFDLVKDFGTSQSPKSTRPSTTY